MGVEKLRNRFKRWLGQVQRKDRDHWTKLLDSNYVGWKNMVRTNHDLSSDSYADCIDAANMEELQKLDCIILDEKSGI